VIIFSVPLIAAIPVFYGRARNARTLNGQAVWLALAGLSGFTSMWMSVLTGRFG